MITASADFAATQVMVKRFASTEVIGSIIICNRQAIKNTVTMWFVPPNVGDPADRHRVLSDAPMNANESWFINTAELSLGNGEEIWVQGGAGATMSITVMRR